MEKEKKLIDLLRSRGMTIASAESLTGGLVAAALVSVPGASNAFMEGFVTYDIAAKHRTLGVPEDILEEYGAISSVTAELMARGAAAHAGTNVAVSTTGNAGPDPSEGKPVGLVYTAVYVDGFTAVKEHHFSGTRPEIREQAAREAINLCLTALKDHLRQE